jgi:hypothetical protein
MASDDEEVGTVTDQYGDDIVMSVLRGDVCIQFHRGPHDFIGMWLGPEEQEHFAQLYVAACHQAKANAEGARAVTPGQVSDGA